MRTQLVKLGPILLLLALACGRINGGDEKESGTAELQADFSITNVESCKPVDTKWILDPPSGGPGEVVSEQGLVTMQWRFELGICLANAQRMTHSDLRILRESTELAVRSFGWNLVDLKNDKTRGMFLKELNGRVGQRIVEDIRVLHVSVFE